MKKNLFLIIISIVCSSCNTGHLKKMDNEGNDLKLPYEIHSKQNLFPNDNLEFYSGYIILTIPNNVRYIDIAESVKNIAIEENLWAAKIFISKIGYLMDIDSIERNYSEYFKSYLGCYDLTFKELNIRYKFRLEDVHFKGNSHLIIETKFGPGYSIYSYEKE